MAMASVVRWGMSVVSSLGVSLLAVEGAPGEARGESGTASSVSASQGVTYGRSRRSTAANDEDGSDYNNDEPDNYEDEGTGEEEEYESSPPPPPQFFSSPVNYTMRPGDDVMFPCQVDSIGKMVQMWSNGTQTITVKDSVLGDKERVMRFQNMSLLIKNVGPEDSGPYTCQIVSQPSANLTHYLKVPAPARISHHSQKKTVVVGQSLESECNVWGYPQPTVKWTLQNKEVPNATFSEGGSKLTVKTVTKHHEGEYKCVADNQIGQPASSNITVNVARFPDIPKYRGSHVEDGKVISKWEVESSVPIEKHEIKYRKQGVVSWNTADAEVKDPQGNIYSVEYALENLSAGNYEVAFHSKNEYGWGEWSESEHFKQSEKLNHEEESPSIEEKPAAETSKRGPDNNDATICTLSSLTSAFFAISVFRTLFIHL